MVTIALLMVAIDGYESIILAAEDLLGSLHEERAVADLIEGCHLIAPLRLTDVH